MILYDVQEPRETKSTSGTSEAAMVAKQEECFYGDRYYNKETNLEKKKSSFYSYRGFLALFCRITYSCLFWGNRIESACRNGNEKKRRTGRQNKSPAAFTSIQQRKRKVNRK